MTHKLCNNCLIPFDTFILFMRLGKERRARENKLKIEDFDLAFQYCSLLKFIVGTLVIYNPIERVCLANSI